MKYIVVTSSFLVEKQQMYTYFWVLIRVTLSQTDHLFQVENSDNLLRNIYLTGRSQVMPLLIVIVGSYF